MNSKYICESWAKSLDVNTRTPYICGLISSQPSVSRDIRDPRASKQGQVLRPHLSFFGNQGKLSTGTIWEAKICSPLVATCRNWQNIIIDQILSIRSNKNTQKTMEKWCSNDFLKISATNENSHDLCPFFQFRAARFPWNSSTKAWMHADSKSFAGCSEETSAWVGDFQLKTDMNENCRNSTPKKNKCK